MKNRYVMWSVCIVLLLIAGTFAKGYGAADSGNYKIVDGIAIYFGVMPAEMILGRPKDHVEREMHGGVPSRGHRDHLVVALFDNATGKRISDARVTATVQEIGLAGETKNLEPMKIADTITYGNYFDMPSRNVYRILVRIRRPGVPGAVEAEFTHRHYPQ